MAEVWERIKQAREDMPVYDSLGQKVGKVRFVHFGVDEYGAGLGPFAFSTENDDLVPPTARELLPRNRVPQETRQRMLKQGFLKVSAGVLSGDCFAQADEIERVDNDVVRLNVRTDQLMKI